MPDLNHPDAHGLGFSPQNRRGNQRVSAAIGYLQSARDRPNLHIRTDCSVRRVLIRDGVARGVEVAGPDGTLERIDAGEVVLCAGAVWDPVLLLRSGIGGAEAVRALGVDVVADLPGVGQHLMDHPCVPLTFVAKPQDAPTDAFVQLFASWSSSIGGERNDLMFNLMNPEASATSSWACRRAPCRGLGRIAHAGGVPGVGDAAGGSRRRAADRSQPPRRGGRPHQDARGDEAMYKLLNEDGVAAHVQSTLTPGDEVFGDDAALDAFLLEAVVSFLHPASTCRAAPVQQGGVVDGDLSVYGVERLRVASASVMPVVTRANPNITCMAIGEVASRLVSGERPAAAASVPGLNAVPVTEAPPITRWSPHPWGARPGRPSPPARPPRAC